jgi:dihydroorotase
MFDLVISGGLIVGDASSSIGSICVTDGKVTAIADPGETPQARETIDAAGLIVLPGLVDAHVHFREPGLTHKEDFASGSRAAAAGGVTTVMVMPTDDPLTTTPETFAEKRALAEGKCHVDFALQAGLGTDTTHVAELARLGAISFELFQTGAPAALNVDDPADLVRCLEAVRDAGAVTGVTPGSASLLSVYADRGRAIHGGAPRAFAAAWPTELEAMGVAQACLAARLAGARIHLRQVSSTDGVATLAALADRRHVTSEVTPHNLLLDESALERLGPVAKVAPPLRPRSDVERVRAALAHGTIDIVATDHAPHTPAEKAAGDGDIWVPPGGFPGVQTWLPLMLGLFAEGVLDYPGIVRACARRPAEIFGLYPGKGALLVGSDADMVLIDPARPMVIRDEDQLSKALRSPFAGLEAPATPVRTILGGSTIMRNGKVEGRAEGRFLHR